MRRVRVPARRRRMSRGQTAGAVGVGAILIFALAGVVAGVLIDRLLDFDDTLDAGGEWDEGGGVSTRWY
jgi:hypothetical protein